MAVRLRPSVFWRSFDALPLRVGLRSMWIGQLLKARLLLDVLTSFVYAKASSKAALLLPLAFVLLSRLNWLLLSMRLSMHGLLVGGDCDCRAT